MNRNKFNTTRELPSIGSSPVIENGTLGLWGMVKIYAQPVNKELTDINNLKFFYFSMFLYAEASINLILLSWLTSLAPGS